MNITIKRTINLDGPVMPESIIAPLYQQENQAHQFVIGCTRAGAPVTLSGSVQGRMIRADGNTVVITGNVSDGKAVVTLPQSAYAVRGRFAFAILNVQGGATTVIYTATGNIAYASTDTQIDPGTVVPDITQLLAQIDAMQQATAAATAAATGALANFAGAFNETAVYTAGQYVTYTNGKFYRLTADHAANVTWANTSKVAVTTGGELIGLKQAIATENANIMANFAGAFVQATAYPAGTYVTYTDGNLYILPNGHEADATWANTTKTQVSVGGELSSLKSALNKSTQVLYKTDISASTGLIQFHAKNGDVITIKTKDGSNFIANDQLRFYNETGSMIDHWSTYPTTVSYRTFTYNKAEAFYIGITQVASSVVNYIVINNSNTYNLDLPVANLQNAIKYQETKKLKLESGTFEEATGTVKIENTARCRNVTPLPLADLVSFSLPDGYSMYIFLLDYNLQKLGTLTWSTHKTKLDFGNASYINFGIRNTSSPSSSIVNDISTIESGIVIRSDFNQLQAQVDDIVDDLYEQTVLLSDTSLHPFPVSTGTDIVITTANGTTLPDGNPYLQCYNSEGTFVTQFLCSSDYGTARTVTLKSGNVAFVKMYATPSKTIKVYIPDNTKIVPRVEEIANIVGQNKIVVDASGSGDYTSFTQAIYATVDSGIDVIVKPGTYNIVSEYVALFGQSAVDSMSDADSSTFNGFQYGVRLRKRKIEFAPGAHLVCDWTGHTVDGTHRFSALGVDYNVEIIGLDLDVTGTFYCIHDDYGISTPYTVKYENCRVVGHSITNANCIGGGCKKYSRHILKNCYFNNNLTGSATVRYHNTNAEGAEPEIYVSDCYFNNWFTPRWYGPQTSKMRVYVNNCYARAIYKAAESSSYNVDNVELYKWCNTETNPVT